MSQSSAWLLVSLALLPLCALLASFFCRLLGRTRPTPLEPLPSPPSAPSSASSRLPLALKIARKAAIILAVFLTALPAAAQEATTTRVWRYTPTLEDVEKGNFCFFFDHAKYKEKLGTPFMSEAGWPVAPTTFDHGAKISYPMLLNDQLGCCFYSSICHHDQTFTGWYGPQSQFNLTTFRQRYLALSGGDNGLSDGDVQGEWKNRYLADVKEAKAFDYLYIDTKNPAVLSAAIYELGGVQFTFTVAPAWISNSDEGAVWEASTYRNNNNGHAVHLVGVDSKGYYKLITWGTYVWISPAAIKVCNPDGFAVMSTRLFNAKGYAPTGRHISDISQIVVAAGGKAFPASIISQFPPKDGPTPGPTPVPGGNAKFIVQIPGQADQVFPFKVPGGGKAVPETTPQELIDAINKIFGTLPDRREPAPKSGDVERRLDQLERGQSAVLSAIESLQRLMIGNNTLKE